jgi:hypothetical protein
MISFSKFLTESIELKKLKHLEHPEDHVIHAGNIGAEHAINTLQHVHNKLTGKKSGADIHMKYDGSPSVVFGHHPETNRFFVATKSAFNKDPKLNYTTSDIKKNHGEQPGLVKKMGQALRHLKKIAPKEGVYQGDLMHSKDEIKSDKHSYHFTPNTLTYSVKKTSDEGKKIGKSKLGIAVHTKYHGKTLEDMQAKFDVNHSEFNHHPDVHIISTKHDVSKVTHTPDQHSHFNTHIEKAKKILATHKDDHLEGHVDQMKMYINHTVKTETTPSVDGYKEHLKSRFKTDKKVKHVDSRASDFEKTLKLHHHIQQAKNSLVNALSSHSEYAHSSNGKPTKPEGFVAHVDNKPTKLVDRNEFSRINLTRERK